MPKKSIEISVIIVRYAVKNTLFACIDSIIKAKTKLPFEIIIVDNNVEKPIKKALSRKYYNVIHVQNHANTGFGSAVNLGVKQAKGKYLFIFNPDMYVYPNCIDRLHAFLKKNKQAGAVAPQFTDTKGTPLSLQGAGILTPVNALFTHTLLHRIFPNNPITRKFYFADADLHKEKEVDVLPGGGFLMEKKLYEDIGGFDENFFMYFEEFDFFRRMKKTGLRCYVIPRAKVYHEGGVDSANIRRTNIFSKSRFYYFRKYYGLPIALLMQLVTGLTKWHIAVFVILLLAGFLRFYRLTEHFPFFGEVGHNLLAIKDAISQKNIPLIGPPTSHPWLYFGPFFYWLYGPVLYFSHFNPLSYGFFGASVSFVTVLVNYLVIRRIFNERIAVVSSLLMAVSPLFLYFSWGARFFSYVPLFSLIFIYFVYKTVNEKKSYAFLLGFLLGSMFSFHYTPLMLIPFVISYLFIYSKNLLFKKYLVGLFGVVVAMLPVFIYDFNHSFSMIKNLLLWIPYRLAGFLGIIPKNNISAAVIHENATSFWEFLRWSLVPKEFEFAAYSIYILLGIYVIFLIHKVIINKAEKNVALFLLLSFWAIIALFIHGLPPIHYYVPVLFVPILLLSLFLDTLFNNRRWKYVGIIVLVSLVMANLFFYFSKQWIYRERSVYTIPYEAQVEVAKVIVKDAGGKSFELRRIGINDEFEDDYAQNYTYLLWLYGNQPRSNMKLVYTVYEETTPQNTPSNTILRKIDRVVIVKSNNL